jgi:hypothetical protein
MKNPFDRRQFLKTSLTGIGATALNACGGGGSAVEAASLPVTVPNPVPGGGVASVANWVPVNGGEVRTAVTTNSFFSQNGRLAGWEYAFGKIVDDFSGGVFNAYWGPLGAMVFHGGGHSATFDNSVVILDFNDLAFKRLSDPTPSNNGANWVAINGTTVKADPAFNRIYCEYGDGQPGSAHTYDTLAILPPADGGAPCGSLIRVSSHAVHVNLSENTGWSHRFDFESTAMRNGTWVRWSVNGASRFISPGACSAFDSQRKRFWWLASLSSAPPMIRYLDVATRMQVDASYASKAPIAPAANPDSMTLRYESVRDILVMTCTVAGKLVIAFLRCASPELGWVFPTLSLEIPGSSGASHPFDYVPEAGKFVLLTSADRSAVYDLVPPLDLDLTWDVVRRPVSALLIPTAYVVGKRWSYAPSVRAFVWMAKSASGVIAYRPFGV